jgi:uncharacterized protein YeaO (DUF488 family)
MLRQASIAQIRSGEVNRARGYVIAGMCYYPRGLRRLLLDEYRGDLAPDRELFREWKNVEKEEGHDAAFERTRYEERFRLSGKALATLRELSLRSRDEEIFLACQCAVGERCHREMLLLLARDGLGAQIGEVFHEYPAWRKRWPLILGAAKQQDGADPSPVKGRQANVDSI